MGVLYYAIYSSKRKRKARLEVYKLINGKYELQPEHPAWMPEIGLGIGAERGDYGGVVREWLYWYDESGLRYSTPNERIQQESQRAKESEQRAEESEQRAEESEQRAEESERRAAQLAQKLRELGIDPDSPT